MKTASSYRSVLLLAFLVAVGCGNEDGSTAPPPGDPALFASGLAAGRPIVGMTKAEIDDVCGRAYVQYRELVEPRADLVCRRMALAMLRGSAGSDEDLRRDCTKRHSSCMREILSLRTDSDPRLCRKPFSSCTATVGELEACFTAMLRRASRAGEGLPVCADWTRAVLTPPDAADEAVLASCEPLQRTCVGLLK